jgi:hypothetical protein
LNIAGNILQKQATDQISLLPEFNEKMLEVAGCLRRVMTLKFCRLDFLQKRLGFCLKVEQFNLVSGLVGKDLGLF